MPTRQPKQQWGSSDTIDNDSSGSGSGSNSIDSDSSSNIYSGNQPRTALVQRFTQNQTCDGEGAVPTTAYAGVAAFPCEPQAAPTGVMKQQR